MWIAFTLLHCFLLALVNYTDEHLAINNKLPPNANIHSKVGSVLLMSTLMSFVGAFILGITTQNISLDNQALLLTIVSAIPMVLMYASYFYLLQLYPVNQIGPLFQISTIWLIIFELLIGESINFFSVMGIASLLYGAYILDSNTFKWKIPTKLLLLAIPATSTWAISLIVIKFALLTGSPTAITFWQLISIGCIGLILFVTINKYREAFIYRLKYQNKKFLSFSIANETFAELSYLFSTFAVSLAPMAAYVSAITGVQSLFLLILFYFFPQTERSSIKSHQWIAIILIAFGVFFIQRNN